MPGAEIPSCRHRYCPIERDRGEHVVVGPAPFAIEHVGVPATPVRQSLSGSPSQRSRRGIAATRRARRSSCGDRSRQRPPRTPVPALTCGETPRARGCSRDASRRRPTRAGDRVTQGDAVVGERSGVEDHSVHRAPGIVEPTDELAFGVGLKVDDRDVGLGGMRTQVGENVGQRVVAVDLRFSRSEKVEVRSVEDEYGSSHWDVDGVSPRCPPLWTLRVPALSTSDRTASNHRP